MRFLRFAILFAALGFVTSATVSGDDKDAKATGSLPSNWSKLGLSDDQKKSIYEIQKKYATEIEKLNKQIAEAKDKEKKEREAVLTDKQKAKLREIIGSKAPPADK